MVIPIIVRELVKFGVAVGSRYVRAERAAFEGLYRGYPKGTGRGIRHGLTAGSVVGSLINNADDSPGNGFQTPFTKRTRSPSRKSYKTRRRQSVQYCRRNSSRY